MIRWMESDAQDDLVWPETTLDLPAPIYGIEERPASIWEALLYGWQHTLVDISPFILPLAVASALGLSLADQARFINYVLFAMGVATLLQTTIGNRLPIIQGPSATLIATLTPPTICHSPPTTCHPQGGEGSKIVGLCSPRRSRSFITPNQFHGDNATRCLNTRSIGVLAPHNTR